MTRHVRLGGDIAEAAGEADRRRWHGASGRKRSGADSSVALDSGGRRRACRGGQRRRVVGTDARGPNSAFKARRGPVAATRRRHADRRARCGERETDRWVPHVSDFRIKFYSRMKIARNK
jgi:hypothetical protein